jgi:hypothetical protein
LRLEDQAFDRAHRLGQKLDVNIYKLTVSNTVEDRKVIALIHAEADHQEFSLFKIRKGS